MHSYLWTVVHDMLGLFAVVRARQHAYTYRGAVRWMSTPNIPRPPDLKSLTTPEDNARARSWVEDFKARQIPRELVELSFARSSGPGGQVTFSPPLVRPCAC